MDWWTEQAQGLRGRIDRGEEFVWFAPYVDGPPGSVDGRHPSICKLGREDSNLRMTESEPAALPLGYAPGWLVWLAKLSPSIGYCQVAGPPISILPGRLQDPGVREKNSLFAGHRFPAAIPCDAVWLNIASARVTARSAWTGGRSRRRACGGGSSGARRSSGSRRMWTDIPTT